MEINGVAQEQIINPSNDRPRAKVSFQISLAVTADSLTVLPTALASGSTDLGSD